MVFEASGNVTAYEIYTNSAVIHGGVSAIQVCVFLSLTRIWNQCFAFRTVVRGMVQYFMQGHFRSNARRLAK